MAIWKRVLFVILVLALIGGGYRVMPSGMAPPTLPISISSTSPGQLRNTMISLGGDGDLQRSLADGRRTALGSPSVREALFAQALAERREMAADRSAGSVLMDLDISLLEQASQTPPHDRRLALLLVHVLRQAAADPELRPLLAETLSQALRTSGSSPRPGSTAPDQPGPAQH